MNAKLIVALSMYGLAMGLATIWFIPPGIEPILWLVIFIQCAWMIARYAPGKPFLHGFCVSLANCVWITSAHILFAGAYLANHAKEAAMTQNTPLSPRLMMAITGPIVGVITGIVLGGLSWVATKFVKAVTAAAP
jgi:hypothetical protein